MIKKLINILFSRIAKKLIMELNMVNWEDENRILQAKCLMATGLWRAKDFLGAKWIQRKEFRVYSQFGDDGILQWLVYFLKLDDKNFVEFGAGDFFESNTHFLLVNNGWRGLVMDGADQNIRRIQCSNIYWRYSLTAKQVFIDRDNINSIIKESDFDKIAYLHIDLDGNDYWILESIDLASLAPDILVLEYNAIYGSEAAVTIPYDSKFVRADSHYSCKYWGASLEALNYLAELKNYYFIGCNSAGNNAYFLANKYKTLVPQVNVAEGFQVARFREARGRSGDLIHLNLQDEYALIAGLPVVNVKTNEIERL
ncbi:hypothetical protein N9K58_07550 [Alphaproteobacteria bacterium]|nr:hypothetical protein [Alphaproteobacteria bacterium]